MGERNQERLTLGAFEPAEGALDTYGPGLRVDIGRALTEVSQDTTDDDIHSVSVVDNSSYVLSGTYEVMDDPEDAVAPKRGLPQMLVVKIDLTLRKGSEVVFSNALFVDRLRDIIKVGGNSGAFRLEDSIRDLHKQIRLNARHPSATLDGNEIKSSPSSKVAVEILTKSVLASKETKPTPRKPQQRQGFPFVPIAVGEVYEVKVHNRSSKEIAVAMTVDGIDQFTFSEDRNSATGRPRFSHWVIGAGKSFTILGWHKTADPNRDDNILRFLVTKYGDGASQFAPAMDASKVGTIQLAISNSHEFRRGARGDSETGFGPPVKLKQKAVRREIDPPHEFISIQYSR